MGYRGPLSTRTRELGEAEATPASARACPFVLGTECVCMCMCECVCEYLTACACECMCDCVFMCMCMCETVCA